MSSTASEFSNITDTPETNSALAAVQEKSAPESRQIAKEILVNKLNYLNFKNESMQAVFKHRVHDGSITLGIAPLPCIGKELDACWNNDTPYETDKMKSYELLSLQFREQKSIISIPCEEYSLTEQGISLDLPENAIELPVQEELIYKAENISASIVQNGLMLKGNLCDFTFRSFKVRIPRDSGKSHLGWINDKEIVTLILEDSNRTIFSAFCRLSRTLGKNNDFYFSLESENETVYRYPPRHYRSTRYSMDIRPVLHFFHPLSRKWTERKIDNISGTGFSLLEQQHEASLIPGLIIKDVVIKFPNRQKAVCSTQVIYRNEAEDDNFNFGLAILDIEPEDHIILMSMLHQSHDPLSYLCKEVDMEELWRFFFNSGFIYPEKYAFLEQFKDEIMETYETLYNKRSDIARHFIYQKDNSILGHLSMVRFFERGWLIHHHAAAMRGGGRAGIHVLNQIGRYINDTHRYRSMNLDYLICFYRPENRFPRKVFGGLVPEVNDKSLCSEDTFAYLHYKKKQMKTITSGLWQWNDPDDEDMFHLENFYQNESGGLMVEAMDLPPLGAGNANMLSSFSEMKINREIEMKTLKHCCHIIEKLYMNIDKN